MEPVSPLVFKKFQANIRKISTFLNMTYFVNPYNDFCALNRVVLYICSFGSGHKLFQDFVCSNLWLNSRGRLSQFSRKLKKKNVQKVVPTYCIKQSNYFEKWPYPERLGRVLSFFVFANTYSQGSQKNFPFLSNLRDVSHSQFQ